MYTFILLIRVRKRLTKVGIMKGTEARLTAKGIDAAWHNDVVLDVPF